MSQKKGRRRKKRKQKKILIGVYTGLILLLAVAAGYIWRSNYYKTHFYKDTWINGQDCSYLTASEVKNLLQETVSEYTLSIKTKEDEIYTVTGPQFHLTYVDDKGVDKLLAEQKPMQWILHAFKGGKYEVSANTTYEEDAVEPILRSLPFMNEANITQPQDAALQETDSGYVITPEVEGNALDEDKVISLVKEAVQNETTELSLADQDCYLKPTVYQNDEALNQQMNTLNSLTGAKLTYTVKGTTSTIDHAVLKSWLVQDENGNYSIDESKEEEFINQLADQIDTYGKSRKFTTHDGAQITLATNKYGWQVDREKSLEDLKEALAEGKEQEMELSYSHKAKGSDDNDLGDVYVEISIDRQTMWCYKNGQVVVETPVVTGDISKAGRATPKNGCWPIFWKTTEYTMNGPRDENGTPEYTTFVHYWMPFNGGVGIHDLASRGNNFGGDIYKTNGSHGCINTPLAAVKTIYETVSVGTPVIVY